MTGDSNKNSSEKKHPGTTGLGAPKTTLFIGCGLAALAVLFLLASLVLGGIAGLLVRRPGTPKHLRPGAARPAGGICLAAPPSSVGFFLGGLYVLPVVAGAALGLGALGGGWSAGAARRLKAVPLRDAGVPKPRHLGRQTIMLSKTVAKLCRERRTPEPEIYLLAQDEGVNAFACRTGDEDAALVVTNGVLRLLDDGEVLALTARELDRLTEKDSRFPAFVSACLRGFFAYQTAGAALRPRTRPLLVPPLLGAAAAALGLPATLAGRLLQAAFAGPGQAGSDAGSFRASAAGPSGDRAGAGAADPEAGSLLTVLLKIGAGKPPARRRPRRNADLDHLFLVAPDGADRAPGRFWRPGAHPPLEDRIRALAPGWNGVYWDFDERPVDRLDGPDDDGPIPVGSPGVKIVNNMFFD
ncbi:MAG: hypothetical protein LBP95_10715 [Deltaproteobacteria bacterium]|jgi:Zn-dependent protease with chaperone function|nr:hypothetical protein [Deltaproteobacteria bacterium]